MPDTEGLPASHRSWVMACALLGVILSGLDSAIANIALPTIAGELHASESATVWVVNIYQIAMTVCLLPMASLSESLGLKRVYGLGLALFTIGSLCCAMSPTLPLLIAARLVQGIGGSCVAALGGALVRTIYPRSMLGQGFALVALAVAISGALGPTHRGTDPVSCALALAVPGERTAGPGRGAAVPRRWRRRTDRNPGASILSARA